MADRTFNHILFLLSFLTSNSYEIKFIRRIEAIGIPYYKISMTLGTCQEHILFTEYKAWPIVKMNRIMDIYYKSDMAENTISSVVIKLVVNNTDCLGFSEGGVGRSDFSATLFFAGNMAAIFFSLTIFTCNRNFNVVLKQNDLESQLPFYTLRRQ